MTIRRTSDQRCLVMTARELEGREATTAATHGLLRAYHLAGHAAVVAGPQGSPRLAR